MYETIRGWITRAGLTNKDEVLGREGWWLDTSGPMLSDEVDMQAWVADRAITKPQGEMRQAAAGPAWKPADYAEMAASKKSVTIVDGGRVVSEETARAWLREAMSFFSAPITVSTRPDPWDLRGDRVVAPDPDPTDCEVPEVEVLVARELGTGPVLLAVSDANMEAARSLLAESDTLLVRMLETEEGRLGQVRAGVFRDHLGASDFTAGNLGNAVQPLDELMLAPTRPSGVTDVDEDEEEPVAPKPRVHKKPEPLPKFRKDEWGFPLDLPPAKKDSTPGSEPPPPEEEPTSEEPAASPPPDQLGTGGSAGAACPDVGSSGHYQSIEPAMRAEVIQERGMKTRIQITGYRDGKYVRGEADNFVVPDASADAVREVLEPIAIRARARFEAAVGAGTAQAKGGPRVRIQLTEYASAGGEYLRQDGSAKAAQNLNAPGMSVAEVAELVDHQIAHHFGVRRGDAAKLVRVWRGFSGESAPEVPATAKSELTGLLARRYNKAVHGGLCAVVSGSAMTVVSLWERDGDAILAARRTGARVVDADGYLVPQAEVEAAPLAAPDRTVLDEDEDDSRLLGMLNEDDRVDDWGIQARRQP